MGIRDDELDAAQTAPGELAQEVGPEGLGFRRADRQAQHLAPAIAIDADRDDHRDRDDVAVAARLHIGRIQPDIGPLAFERTVEEGGDLAVDLAAQVRFSTSSSISRCAAYPIISRSRSVSELFSKSA